jgi:hypothetical protein
MIVQYFLQLKVILLFKDDEPNVDLEATYALGRRISNCPSTKFRV